MHLDREFIGSEHSQDFELEMTQQTEKGPTVPPHVRTDNQREFSEKQFTRYLTCQQMSEGLPVRESPISPEKIDEQCSPVEADHFRVDN